MTLGRLHSRPERASNEHGAPDKISARELESRSSAFARSMLGNEYNQATVEDNSSWQARAYRDYKRSFRSFMTEHFIVVND